MKSLKQFKLVSGEEVICDVLDTEFDQDTGDVINIIVKNVYSILTSIDNNTGNRYYTFKPFLTIQGKNSIVSINPMNIIAIGSPHKILADRYFEYIEEFLSNEDISDEEVTADSIIETLKNLLGDSDFDGRVIPFRNPKLH